MERLAYHHHGTGRAMRLALWSGATRVRHTRAILCLGALALALAVMVVGAPHRAAHAAANAIQIENSYPGDPTWNSFAADPNPATISGYASQISVNHGESIDLFVTTTAQSFSVNVYRTGWYGGVGARLMQQLGTFQGVQNAIPAPAPVTGLIACHWPKTTTLTIPSTWTTGVYLAKLTTDTNKSSFIYFVVRDDGGHEDFLVQTSVTTYQAYNAWGGTSLYSNVTDRSVYSGPHATKVSFDRPFNPGDSNGAGHYFFFEYQFVRWAESQGFDLSYSTDVDTHANVTPLTNHKGFLVVGHDEYWSLGMRQNVQSAINAGVNVAFLGANISYWQIRFEPSDSGAADRVEVGYKDFATANIAPGPDPMWNVDNTVVTTNWRAAPVSLPENGLIGVMFEDENQTDQQPYVVSDASSWVFAGTGFVNGSSVPGIVGYEYDKVYSNGASPAGLSVLSNSPVTGQSAGASFSNSSVYTAASGARVFAAGTIEWSWGLDNYGGRTYANAGIQRTMANILYNFNGGSPPPPPPPLPEGIYVQDGFESGNLTQWSGPNGTGQGTAEVTTVKTGTYAASLTNMSGGSFVTLSQHLAGGAQAQTYTRFYVNLGDATNTSTLATGTDANGVNLWAAVYDASRAGLDVFFWNGARTRFDLYSNTNIMQPNTWYSVEIQDSEAAAGAAQVWLDGVSLGTITGDLSAANAYSRLFLWNDGPGTLYYDNVRVASTYNGPAAPHVSLSATSLDFGNQSVQATTAAQTLTLTNTGEVDVAISGIAINGANASDFTQTTTCGAVVASLSACAISVSFAPGDAGARAATLTVSDGAADSPQSIALSGSGLAADVRATITTNKSTVKKGSNIVYTITVTNMGPGAAPGLVITDAVPVGTTYVTATLPTGVICATPAKGSATGTLRCTSTSALASGASVVLTMTLKVGSNAGSTLTDTGTVSLPVGLHYDPDLANNTSTLVTRTQ